MPESVEMIASCASRSSSAAATTCGFSGMSSRCARQLLANEALQQCWLVLGVEVSTAFAVYWTYFDQIDMVDFHLPIVEAIRAGDVARAGAEARKHVRRTEQVVRRRTRGSGRRIMSAAIGKTALDSAGAPEHDRN